MSIGDEFLGDFVDDYYSERERISRAADLLQQLDDMRRERDAARAEVERWKAKFADQAAVLASADADRIRLVGEVDDLWAQLKREIAECERLRGLPRDADAIPVRPRRSRLPVILTLALAVAAAALVLSR